MTYIHFKPRLLLHDESGQAVTHNHYHIKRTMPVAEFLFITEGELQMYQRRNYSVKANEGMIVLPNEEHSGPVPCSFTMHWTHFFLPEDAVVDETPYAEGRITIPVWFRLPRPDRSTLLANLLESYPRTPQTANTRNALFTTLLFDIAEQNGDIATVDRFPHKRFNTIYNYIHSNIRRFILLGNASDHAFPEVNLDLKSIAETFGYNEKYLSSLFQKYLHTTPHRFIEQEKLRVAAERLLNTDYTVAAIAALLGYASPQHFMKQFKKYYGVTPTQYRNRNLFLTEIFNDDSNA